MQATNDGLYDWNLVTNDIYYSPAWKRMLGYADDELENEFSVWERLTDPEDAKALWEMLHELLDRKRDRFEREFKMRHKDGHWVDILSRANAVFDDQGKGVRVVGTHLDISERKRVEEEIKGLAKFPSENPNPVLRVRKNGLIIYANQGSMPLLHAWGCQETQSLPEDKHKFILDVLSAGSNKTTEVVCVDRILSLTFTPVKDADYVNGYGLDITQRKQAELALKENSERLEDMVAERTKKLEDVQEKLLRQEKLAALGQLAGSVAHELRHPLGVLSNAAYFLNMLLPDASEMIREYLDIMTAETRKADKIISDLLGFSKGQPTSKGSRTRVRLSELIAGVLAEQPPSDEVALAREIDVEVPPIFVDAQQIQQAIRNMVINAYQSMPDGGTLTIATRFENEQVIIDISDTGGGISPDNLEKLFEPLFTTKPKGIGLGLAISKNLIEANGGYIEVVSTEGRGSTFTLILPIQEDSDEHTSYSYC
jgi:PAS domain S-box-containing protein